MSWNPLNKKPPSRSPSRPCTSSDEIVIENCVSKLIQLEKVSRKLHKDTKKHGDGPLITDKTEQKITGDLSATQIVQEDDELRHLVEDWHAYTKEIEKHVAENVFILHKTVVEPMKKFNAIFGEVNNALKKQEQIKQEGLKLKLKLQKFEEKERTAQNQVKQCMVEQALEKNNKDLMEHNELLAKELPLLYDARVDYFQPSLEAIIFAQTAYWGESAKLFGVMQVPQVSGQSKSSKAQIQQMRLASIRALSIVADK